VETLLENGASIDEQDQNGQTALHLALRRKHREIGLFLINRGCGLNIYDNVNIVFAGKL
jgi:ankyrin repeat protein